jgi:hypothetical protein
MTKHTALASDEFIILFKVLEARAVDNSRPRCGVEDANNSILRTFVHPSPTEHYRPASSVADAKFLDVGHDTVISRGQRVDVRHGRATLLTGGHRAFAMARPDAEPIPMRAPR